MPERLIVTHCSPTLAGLKTGSLFTCDMESEESLLREIAEMNQRLGGKGIRVLVLGYTKGKALIYMYRPDRLDADLRNKQTEEILRECGYTYRHAGDCLTRLIARLKSSDDFPHEIGCFLGYPPEDVRGFIEKDRPCKLIGAWRVYGDEKKAFDLFEQYRLCTRSYLKHLSAGVNIEELAVAC